LSARGCVPPFWLAALQLSATSAGGIDLFARPAGRLNAYAAGGRSAAVNARVLEDYRAGRLSEAHIVAVLVHELGHHATGATRPMLITMWRARRGGSCQVC
jgi:STE24 endopeptidase